MANSDDRPITRRELRRELISALGVDIDDAESLQEHTDRRQWVRDQKKKQETSKERRTASLAGIGYGMIGTIATATITWATGVLQWAQSILTIRH